MSLMGMNRAFKKHGALLGGMGALLMLIVALSGLGANVLRGGAPTGPGEGTAGNAEQPVATVGTLSITRGQLDGVVNSRLAQYGMNNPDPAHMDEYRMLFLDQYKQQAGLEAAAKAAGLKFTDDELTAEREKLWAEQRPGLLEKLGLDAKATDADIDKALVANGSPLTVQSLKPRVAPDEAVTLSLDQQGLQNLAKKQNKVTEDQAKRSYDEIQVRHILVKSGEGGLPDAQAKEKADKILAQIVADPSKMPQLAKENTDDPGSKATGGFYDWAPVSKYDPAFGAGALAAGVGKVNPQLVKSSFGYHIIKLEGDRPGKDFPKDWDKNKQKYIDDFIAKQAEASVSAQVAAQLPNIKVTVLDPGMKAAQALQDSNKATDPNAKNAKLNEALADLNQIKPADYATTQAPLRRAEILKKLNRPKDAIAAYLDSLASHNNIDTRLTLAELYQSQNDKPNALKQVQEAQKLAVPDPETEEKIATLLGNLGDADGAKKAHDRAAEMRKTAALIAAQDAAAQKAAEAAAKAAAPKSPAITMPTPAGSPTTAAPSPATAPAASASPATTTATPATPATPVAPPAAPATAPAKK